MQVLRRAERARRTPILILIDAPFSSSLSRYKCHSGASESVQTGVVASQLLIFDIRPDPTGFGLEIENVHKRVLASASRAFGVLQQWWSGLALRTQFTLAAAIVLLGGMIAIGLWVADRVVRAVMFNTAAAVALYMESSVAPLIQELQTSDQLTPATQQRLDELLGQPAIGEHILSIRIWRLDGTVVYSRWKELIGRQFPISGSFHLARKGELAIDFAGPSDGEDAGERALAADLIEIHAPVRETHSRRVIAVAEFYAAAKKLRSDVRSEVASSWLIVGHVTLYMMAALWGIVARGSRIIDEQRGQLKERIGELQSLLAQNEDLRVRLQRSNATVADANEQFLRRIGADLHDGPAQLLSYTLLRLHKLAPLIEKAGSEKERRELLLLRESLGDTLREVRNISEGLALPELGPIALREVIELAISSHERVTGTRVLRRLEGLPEDTPQSLKICVYRLVQEGLTNAFRHAQGQGQAVSARGTRVLEVGVSDFGPGFELTGLAGAGLGLAGLRARIEAIGGRLEICSTPGQGTHLAASFDLKKVRHAEVVIS
jgi:signal transduction histidine kinase